MAMFYHRRRQYHKCTGLCSEQLNTNPRDQAALYLKCSALLHSCASIEQECNKDLWLELNGIAMLPRFGTSLEQSACAQNSQPVIGSLLPSSGFERLFRTDPRTGPGITGPYVEAAIRYEAEGHMRPASSLCWEARLVPESLNASNFNFTRLAHHGPMRKLICDFLIYHEHKPRRALELCLEMKNRHQPEGDWWWEARLGICYLRLGLYRDAEMHLLSSIQCQQMSMAVLALSEVYLRLDQPNTALNILEKAKIQFSGETQIWLATARIYDVLYALNPTSSVYKAVLSLDPSNVEGLSSLAAAHFYSYQPEIGLRYYRRLLQMGVIGPEIWNNIGLCCLYSAHFDMALRCFRRSLQYADDRADIWYNIGHVGISTGNKDLAYQALHIALSIESEHAESLCNLGVLEIQNQNAERALTILRSAQSRAPHLYQPFYNGAVLAFRFGNIQDSLSMVSRAKKMNCGHSDSHELQRLLLRQVQAS